MGIFSRIGEIVNANISAMLEKAEDPVKMVKMMIHEMEDTLMEIKSSAAEVIAEEKRINRNVRQFDEKSTSWQQKAELAVSRGRDDLAREALEQKLAYTRKGTALKGRQEEIKQLVDHYRADILRLEEKLQSARLRQRSLMERQQRQAKRRRVEEHIYQATTGNLSRFDQLESRIDRVEADADVVAMSNESLDRRFEELEHENEVEKELESLKQKGRAPKKRKKDDVSAED